MESNSTLNKSTTGLTSNNGQVATVADIVAPEIAAMGKMNVATVDTVKDADKVNIIEDPTVRNSQMNQLGRLDDVASGKVPTVSEMMFKQNLDRILKAQNAQASTTRGAQGSLLAQREGQIKANDMMAEASTTAAQLRIQEQRDADAAFTQAANSIRSMDVTKLVEQAKVDTQTNIANLNVRAERAIQQANIQQQAYTTEYTTEADRRKANANMQMQASVQNQQKNLQTAIANAQNKTSMINTQVDAETKKYAADTGAAASIQSASINAAASQAIAAANLQANKYTTDVNAVLRSSEMDSNNTNNMYKNVLNSDIAKAQIDAENRKIDALVAQNAINAEQAEAMRATSTEKILSTIFSTVKSYTELFGG